MIPSFHISIGSFGPPPPVSIRAGTMTGPPPPVPIRAGTMATEGSLQKSSEKNNHPFLSLLLFLSHSAQTSELISPRYFAFPYCVETFSTFPSLISHFLSSRIISYVFRSSSFSFRFAFFSSPSCVRNVISMTVPGFTISLQAAKNGMIFG